MRDIFICTHGNLLDSWLKACPNALVSVSVSSVLMNEPVIFWVHANANSQPWLETIMADIQRKFQTSKIVILSNTPNQAEALLVIKNGAVGYCHAYSQASLLTELKAVVTHGGLWLGQDLLQTLIGATKEVVHNAAEHVNEALALLTTREKEVALNAASGLSNKEIARLLKITERTVKAHISKSLEKLAVKDRLQLALVLNDKSDQQQTAGNTLRQVKSKLRSKKQTISKKYKKKLDLAA